MAGLDASVGGGNFLKERRADVLLQRVSEHQRGEARDYNYANVLLREEAEQQMSRTTAQDTRGYWRRI